MHEGGGVLQLDKYRFFCPEMRDPSLSPHLVEGKG